MAMANVKNIELATFGAGCFWSTEKYFRNQFGSKLNSAVVGYMIDDASLIASEEVYPGATNHVEVLQVSFHKQKLLYDDLVHFFFQMHDPTTLNRLEKNRTTQYRSVIFTHTEEQQRIAEGIREEIQAGGKIRGQTITEIQPVNGFQFRIAEQKHQNYLENKYGWLKQSFIH